MNASEQFLELIKSEFKKRMRKNPSYSLRALARDLDIESSRLSKILRKERPISPPLMEKFGERLGIELQKIELLKNGSASKTDSIGRQLTLDVFKIISDNIHYSILELMKVKGFSANARWIAKRLDKNINEVNAAIEKLVAVGLMKIHGVGTWEDESAGHSTHVIGKNYTSYAHKISQTQILEQSKEALRLVPIEFRDHSSMMMASNTKKIAEAKEKIRRFRKELCEFLEDTPEKDCVFQLQVSLFPIDQFQKLKNNKKRG